MQLHTIRDFVAKQPFSPFRMNLVDGSSVTVQHPEFISFPPASQRFARDCVVWKPGGGMYLLDVMHVLTIELLETASPEASDTPSDES